MHDNTQLTQCNIVVIVVENILPNFVSFDLFVCNIVFTVENAQLNLLSQHFRLTHTHTPNSKANETSSCFWYKLLHPNLNCAHVTQQLNFSSAHAELLQDLQHAITNVD